MGRVRAIALATAVIIFFSLTVVMVAAAASTYPVEIQDGTQITQVDARSDDPQTILQEANIVLNSQDKVDSTQLIPGKASKLIILRACAVTIAEAGKQEISGTQYGTVADALQNTGIVLQENDRTIPEADALLQDGMQIQVLRNVNLMIQADGKEIPFSGILDTVAQVLQEAGVSYSAQDIITPALDENLVGVTNIRVQRVTTKTRTERETISFASQTKETYDMTRGEKKVKQAGKNGVKETVYLDRFVDGELEKSTIQSETVIEKPIAEIIVKGLAAPVKLKSGLTPISELTPPSSLKLDGNGIPTKYKKVITGTAKAYTGGGTTATGRPARTGHIAVDPKQIPYGTELYVVSSDGQYVYGYCIAADTGGFVETNGCTVDLYMNSESQCYQWGHRGVQIYVL